MIERVKQWVRSIKRDVVALYVSGRDPRTPWHAKAVSLAVIAYAISPIDCAPALNFDPRIASPKMLPEN